MGTTQYISANFVLILLVCICFRNLNHIQYRGDKIKCSSFKLSYSGRKIFNDKKEININNICILCRNAKNNDFAEYQIFGQTLDQIAICSTPKLTSSKGEDIKRQVFFGVSGPMTSAGTKASPTCSRASCY